MKYSLRKAENLLPSVLLAVAVGFLLAVYAPVELFLTNRDDFWFNFTDLLPICLTLFAGIVVGVLAVLLLLSRWSRVQQAVLAAGFGLLAAAYVQGNFLAGGLPALTGEVINWNRYPVQRALSALVWLGFPAGMLVWNRLKGFEIPRKVICAGSGFLTLMLLPTLVTVGIQTGATRPGGYLSCTYDEMETYSTDRNVVVIMLDSIDGGDFTRVLTEDPSHAEALADFTYFDNTVCAYPFTQYSLPYILSGKWYENECSLASYRAQALKESPLLAKLEEESYRKALYTPEPFVDIAENDGRFVNMVNEQPTVSSKIGLAKIAVQMAGVKYAPLDFKRFSYTLPDTLEALKKGGDWHNLYVWRCDEFSWIFKQLTPDAPPFELTDAKEFKYIHLDGAHANFKYDPTLNLVEGTPEGTYDNSLRGCIYLVEEYVKMLKEKGIYDQTALVVMGDHGYNVNPETQEISSDYHQHCMVMVKGFGESHPFAINDAPISYEDLQTAFARLIDGGEAAELFDWKEGDTRKRRFLEYGLVGDPLTEYYQTGFAGDRSTLIPTGTVYPAPKN